MTFREHPLLLRQNFVKLWPNNIFLYEEKPQRLHFISFYQNQVLLASVLYYRYTKLVGVWTNKNEVDFDQYLNLYKYQRNARKKKKRHIRGRLNLFQRGLRKWGEERALMRGMNQEYTLLHRFIKNSLYQQLLRELINLVRTGFRLLIRVREPIRRLSLLDKEQIRWFRRYLRSSSKQKHFINTINQIILLHYYKSTPLFVEHFARELEKVHKKVHWRLIHNFGNLLLSVPFHPTIRRQYYGLLIEIKGRPRGRARTFIFRMREGALAPQSYSFRISFGMGEALAKVGAVGLKIWITY